MSDTHEHVDDLQIDFNEYVSDLSETHAETVGELSRKLAGQKSRSRALERKLVEQAQAIDALTEECARLKQFEVEAADVEPKGQPADLPPKQAPTKER